MLILAFGLKHSSAKVDFLTHCVEKIPACNFCFPLLYRYVLLKGSDRLCEWNSTKLARHVKIIETYRVTGSPLWLEFLSEWGKNQFNRMNFEHPSPNYENSNFEQYSKYSVLCFNKNWDLATKNLIYLKTFDYNSDTLLEMKSVFLMKYPVDF